MRARHYGWIGVGFLVLAVGRFLLGNGLLWHLGVLGGGHYGWGR